MLHALLQRQLNRVGIEDHTVPPDADVWLKLLERISRSYTEADQDRYLLERSLSVSSEEMQAEITERKQAEAALQAARDNLERQNRLLERINEFIRSTVEQMTESVQRNESQSELLAYLRLMQTQFERMEGS
jgi:hypothetical protein